MDKIYLIKFNSNNIQENFVEKSDNDISIMEKNGIIVDDTWLEAPEGFIPDQSVCKLNNGVVSLVNDIDEDFMILFNEFGLPSMWFVKGSETNDKILLDSAYENKYFIAPSYFNPKDDKLCFLDIFTKVINPSSKQAINSLSNYISTGQQNNLLEDLDYARRLRKEIILQNKIVDLRKLWKDIIYNKYSVEAQMNIDREALPLKAFQTLDATRLEKDEIAKIAKHEKMNKWINERRTRCEELILLISSMSIEDLISFNIYSINEQIKNDF